MPHSSASRRRFHRPALFALLLAACPAPAAATATLECSGGNGPFRIATTVTVGQTAVSAIGGASGALEIKTRPLPPDLLTVALTRDDLVHHWIEGGQINLHFYRERDAAQPFGFVEAVLTTRKADKGDGDYSGRFRIKVSYLRKAGDAQPVEFMTTGWVKCTLG